MPDSELRPDRLPSDMVFTLTIGNETIDLAAMSYGDVFATFQSVLGAVRHVLRAKANEQEEAEQPAAAGAHGARDPARVC